MFVKPKCQLFHFSLNCSDNRFFKWRPFDKLFTIVIRYIYIYVAIVIIYTMVSLVDFMFFQKRKYRRPQFNNIVKILNRPFYSLVSISNTFFSHMNPIPKKKRRVHKLNIQSTYKINLIGQKNVQNSRIYVFLFK